MSVKRARELGNEEEFVVETEERERQGFGTDNELGKEESYLVENGGETVSNKRMKEMQVDRLSALPDSLILRILYPLSLDTKQVAITSVLSKRWQFLWSDLPVLRFCDSKWDAEKTAEFVCWIHRTMIFRGESHLGQLWVDFLYDECYAEDVDVWVLFAVVKKVERLHLLLHSSTDFYTLPQVLYSHPSLTCLFLQQCIVAPDREIEWPCLTYLLVKDVEFPEDVFRKILSGCPVLHNLFLESCWEFKRLDVNSESLYDLSVYDPEDKNSAPLLEISAPYLSSLDITFSPTEKKLQLINVQSLVSAAFDFTEYDYSEEVMNNTMELLEKTLHAKELILGGPCVEVISELVVNGWRLPQSRRKSLVLETCREDKSITSILGLLESSPNLESLRIECVDSFEKSAKTWVPAARNDLDCDLSNLKIVRLLNCADPNLGGEPMLTIARTLLKRATKLEMMKIKAQGNLTKFASEFTKMSDTVLSYPRSSERAVVVLLQ